MNIIKSVAKELEEILKDSIKNGTREFALVNYNLHSNLIKGIIMPDSIKDLITYGDMFSIDQDLLNGIKD